MLRWKTNYQGWFRVSFLLLCYALVGPKDSSASCLRMQRKVSDSKREQLLSNIRRAVLLFKRGLPRTLIKPAAVVVLF